MKTKTDVVNVFFKLLTGTGTGFRHSYPDGYSADSFTVINTLPVPHDSIQEVQVNVNCYKKDMFPGVPDELAINSMAVEAISRLHGFKWHKENEQVVDYLGAVIVDYNDDPVMVQTVCDKVHIQFETMDLLREQEIGMHFMNLRFTLIYLNN